MSESYSQILDHQIIERYRREVDSGEVAIDEIAHWALQKGLWQPPIKTQMALLKKDLSNALRAKTFVDDQGRKVRSNYCVRREMERENGSTYTQSVWASIDIATPGFMKTSFDQRRENIANMCHQVSVDVEHWNEFRRGSNSPIQMHFDFTDDLADRAQSEDYIPPSMDDL